MRRIGSIPGGTDLASRDTPPAPFGKVLSGILLAAAFLAARPAGALTLNGSASQSGGVLRLTPAAEGQAGSAWSDSKQPVQGGFTTSFTFRITDLGGVEGLPPGADGLAFVVQNSSGSALGGGGGGIGYDGIPNSLAVEFDTWQNFEHGDPNDNHVSIHTLGTSSNSADESASLGLSSSIPNLSDGSIHSAGITYVPGSLSLSVDGATVLTVSVDLASLLSLDAGRAYVGFTAATGAAWENHDILSWSFQPTNPGLLGQPNAAQLRVAGNGDQTTLSAGQCVTLVLKVRSGGSQNYVDVSHDTNTSFFTDPHHGSVQGNTFCVSQSDAGTTFPIYGRYRDPATGVFVTDTVIVHVSR